MEVSELPNRGMTKQSSPKTHLLSHTQRSAIPLPLYQTFNEGSLHAPQFRSTVIVDGAMYTSPSTFARRKVAEQDVARVALEGIFWKIKHEGVPLIDNDTIFCKSILYEYAAKSKIEKPTYTTAESKGLFQLFISSVGFNGETYTGREGKNKKEAEQIGARTVIQSILGHSNTGITMYQIIKSKDRLFTAVYKGGVKEKVQGALTNGKLPVEHLANPANSTLTEAKAVVSETVLSALPQSYTPDGSTDGVVSVPAESNLAQSIQVKKAVPLDDPSLVSNGSQSMSPNSDRKRSSKTKRKKHSKKARTNELDSLRKDLNLTACADDCESPHVCAW